MYLSRLTGIALAAATVIVGLGTTASAQLMIIGNDQKPKFDNGATTMQPPGKDTLSVVDIAKPAEPRIVATIAMDNTIAGPPTNLAITPNRDLALVANSLKAVEKDGKWRTEPDDRLFVVDLKANPPAVVATVNLGKQPSGLAINQAGTMALVANRADGTISVLSINGKEVKVTDTVTVGAPTDQVSAVAITPDGKTALAVKSAVDKVAVLTIDNGKASYDKKNDLPANNYPYNVAVTPNGQIALIANTGGGGSSDGHADTVSVVDLTAKPIRVVDHITVGDSPEGLAISPKGNLAVTIEARGSNRAKDNWVHQPAGAVTVLGIDGKKVTRLGEAAVGLLPEGGAFSADGSYLYIGNFIDSDLSVFRVTGTQLAYTGQRFKLPGQPASVRAGPQ
ncbi:MAG TPA: beta-propeller fold lactonase family protein [Stellaceae bacterium]|nr:beta-propeller fold lactonase family protein [Stellaceae bacterium]